MTAALQKQRQFGATKNQTLNTTVLQHPIDNPQQTGARFIQIDTVD